MDAESQARQTKDASAQKRGALRFRTWQRLRGQKAFRRERNSGVYRHSAAALIRILPPLEIRQIADNQENTAAPPASSPALPGATPEAAPPIANATPRAAEITANAQTTVTESAINAPYIRPCRRLGVVASRKVGNAVARNRAKRIWREIFRLNQHFLPAGCDVLIIVRKDFANTERKELDALFADAARRARRAFGDTKR